MLKLQRRYLVQKIWRAREVCVAGDQVTSAKAFGFLKEAVHNFLATLELTSLRVLAKIVSERHTDVCLRVDGEDCCVRRKQRYLISRVWRWPDLNEGIELKHISDERSSSSSSEEGELGMAECLCVNPFHFSRISKREIPYQGLRGGKTPLMTADDSGLSCGTADSDECSDTHTTSEVLATNCRTQEQRKRPWLTLAYWERDKRVGNMYHGHDNSINIYESKAKGDTRGLCLRDLNRTFEMNDPTKVVFRNIGEGIQVSLEDGDIWVYNKSESPVFLNGELLQRLHHTDTPRVEKLPSGYGLKVYDCKTQVSTKQITDSKMRREEPHCLRVSFVKGFGRGYKRQTIMNCPCWVDMFFSLPKS